MKSPTTVEEAVEINPPKVESPLAVKEVEEAKGMVILLPNGAVKSEVPL